MAEKTLFDLLTDVTSKKVPANKQDDIVWKQFPPYMVNRFISMNMDYIDMVNEIQLYTPILSPKEVYTVYSDLLPKSKVFFKYIGAKKEKSQEKLIELIANFFSISKSDAEDWITRTSKKELIDFVKKFGYTDKEVIKKFEI